MKESIMLSFVIFSFLSILALIGMYSFCMIFEVRSQESEFRMKTTHGLLNGLIFVFGTILTTVSRILYSLLFAGSISVFFHDHCENRLLDMKPVFGLVKYD